MQRTILATALGLLTLWAVDARAQPTAWGDNGYVSFQGMYQGTVTTFQDTVRLTRNQEQGSLTAGHEIKAGPAFDVSAGGRIKGHLGFGFGVSYFRRRDAVGVAASIPHPFFFSRPRGVSGSVADVMREERAIHASAMWLLPVSERIQVAVFGGPSYFRVEQGMITAVGYAEDYPYDQARFVSATTTGHTQSGFGFNAGADASFFFSRYVGVGGLVRFSRARLEPSPAHPTGVRLDVGGLQTGAGLRFRF